MTDHPKVIFYGAHWCNDCARVKQWLGTHELEYEWKNTDDEKIEKEMLSKNGDNKTIPTLLIGDKVLVDPTNEELAEAFGKEIAKVEENFHDVVMIGAGPTALAAAIYTTREDIDTVLLEKGVVGGLAAVTDTVENYPGFPDGIGGMELAMNLRKQAEKFGAKIELAEVTGIKDEGQYKRVVTTSGDYLAKAVLIATGSDYRKLGIPGEEEFYGKGVHYCATCDGALYRDKRLVVVGGGNSAAQEGIFLTKFASHVDVLIRGPQWKASDVLVNKISNNDKITVHFNTTTDKILGGGEFNLVNKVIGHDKEKGEDVEIEADGVFVFVGLSPNTGFLKETGIELDDQRFVKTNSTLTTDIEGVYAAGDVRSGATMQIASAVGEGATAALMIREYLENH